MATVRVGRRTPLRSTSITRTTAEAASSSTITATDRTCKLCHDLHSQAKVLAADAT